MEMARVGMKTRAPAALAMEVSAASSATRTHKRRKIKDANRDLQFPKSSFVQLTSDTVVIELETKSVLPQPDAAESCSSPNSEIPASCCSSTGSIELNDERTKFLDLEVESAQVETSTSNCGDERKEIMSLSCELGPNSQELESAKEKATEADSRLKTSISQSMPTELELEEFFSTAEKEIQKEFSDKYNYDIAKDVPLEGRYEWVQLKP